MSTNFINPFEPVILASKKGDIQVHIIPFGLTVHRLLVSSPSGRQQDLIVGPENPSDHHAGGRNFFGPVVGRFANRLPAHKSSVSTAQGKQLDLNLPEWGGEGVCHHGGPEAAASVAQIEAGTVPVQAGPFDRLVWTPLVDAKKHSQLFKDSEHTGEASAVFAVRSPSGDNGFPGELLIEARFSIEPNVGKAEPPALGSPVGSVRVEYRAKILDKSAQVTPLNITQHWGFNLSAGSQGSTDAQAQTVDDHQLRFIVPSQGTLQRLDLDSRGVPTGKLIPCPNENPHGWASSGSSALGKTIGHNMPEGGYDHFYTWGGRKDKAGVDRDVVALLHAASTGTTLAFRTNQSGCQVYTANGQPAHPAPTASSGGSRKLLHRSQAASSNAGEEWEGNPTRSAAFLEFSHPHALFLHKSLQEHVGGEDAMLRDGEVYVNWCAIDVWQGK